MNVQKVLIFVLLFLMFSVVKAQDIIRFADGKILECKVEGITDTTVWFIEKPYKKNPKETILRNDDIFSVVFGDTSEVVVYKPDASDKLAFNVEQMRNYVAGASFARRNYKAIIPTTGAFIAGAGGGLLGFWGLLIPLTYDLGISSYLPRAKNYRKEPLPPNADEFFAIGYQDVANKRRTHRIIASSFAGVVAIVVYTTLMTKGE